MTRIKFDPKAPIAHYLIARGIMPVSHLEIVERCHEEVDREDLDHKTAIGLTATGLVTGGVMLAALGVGPFLLPAIASVAVGGLGVWNHPLRAQRREDEADFIRSNPGLLPLMTARMDEGHPAATIKAAYSEAFRAWRSTGKPDLDVMALGATAATAGAELLGADGLPCVEVQAATTVATGQPIAPGHQPIAPGATQAPIAVHAHTNITNVLPGRQQAKPIGHAIPAPGQVQTEPPDLSLYPDPADRAMALMTAMAKAGMPIGSILKHPFVMAIGGSQSGKTSFAAILSILRLATGCNVTYASVDRDVPEVRWTAVTSKPLRYLEMMDSTAELISDADKGQLKGQSWVFDELLRSSQEHGADMSKLLVPCLCKGAKSGALMVVLTHAKTCSAHNLKPGFSEAWQRDRVAVEAQREGDEFGEYTPTGEYLVSIPGKEPQLWRWPEWMLTNLDPVGWVLDAFPEFKGKALEGADRGQDMPLAPTAAAPAWASMGAVQTPVQTPVQGGSNVVQGRFSGSGMVQGSNHGSESVQALNQREPGTFGALEVDGSRFMNRFEPAEPTPEPANSPQFFTNLNLNRSDTIDRITALKNAGLNQGQIILALWGCPKGGSKGYTDALAQYKELTGE
jgi:hypothetical protein